MNRLSTPCVLCATIVVTFAAASHAARVVDAPPPTAQSVRQSAKPTAAAKHADDSSGLRQGVVTAVAEKGERVQIEGVWLRVAPGQTMVFRQGRVTTADTLSKGQKVKFTLAPGDATRSTLGAVHVQ